MHIKICYFAQVKFELRRFKFQVKFVRSNKFEVQVRPASLLATQVEQYHAVSGRHRRDGCDPDRERSASLFSAPASVTGGFLAGGREKTATRR